MASEPGSREHILSRIRAANRRTPGPSKTSEIRNSLMDHSAAAAWDAIPHTYRRASTCAREATLDLLRDRLRDYDARTFSTTRDQLPDLIASRMSALNQPRMIVPPGFPPGMLPSTTSFTLDNHLTAAELDTFAGVLTMATLAIAETGTLVLQNVPGQGRRATNLIPDYHLCVVDVEDVVQTVSEGIERLRSTSTLPTTFVSGPSATADIEMTRIKGVHGPRFLEIILYSQ